MRKCQKCNNTIPNNVKVNGETKSLRNRKHCLECTPFGSRKSQKVTNKKDKHRYDQTRKEQIVLSLYKRALERRQELLDDKGGKCQICSYARCKRALSFHHRDPANKKFGLTLNNLWSKTWDAIQQEADKCDLLCSNCHMEVEDEKHDITRRVNEKYGTLF